MRQVLALKFYFDRSRNWNFTKALAKFLLPFRFVIFRFVIDNCSTTFHFLLSLLSVLREADLPYYWLHLQVHPSPGKRKNVKSTSQEPTLPTVTEEAIVAKSGHEDQGESAKLFVFSPPHQYTLSGMFEVFVFICCRLKLTFSFDLCKVNKVP